MHEIKQKEAEDNAQKEAKDQQKQSGSKDGDNGCKGRNNNGKDGRYDVSYLIKQSNEILLCFSQVRLFN